MDSSENEQLYYKPVSLRLWEVLDLVGLSEDNRNTCHELYRRMEILGTLRPNSQHEMYIFGSSCEGTRTMNMDSDFDYVLADTWMSVVQNITEAPQGLSVLLVQQETTKAGYGKLQLLENGNPISSVSFDNNFSGFLPHDILDITKERGTERHGPAINKPEQKQDKVLAFKCSRWPDCARDWFKRIRNCNWPSSYLIAKMQHYGFFMVPVGHPHSNEQHLEWRISLSLQERLLMFSLNPVQFRCYVMLKMIKADIISHFVKTESISSYHCKTCILYVAENTPAIFWRPENMLTCLDSCLELLLKWAEEGVCPNYFIPEENMFERKVTGQIQLKLKDALQHILSSNGKYLLSLKAGGISSHIQRLSSTLCIESIKHKFILHMTHMGQIMEIIHVFLRSLPIEDISKMPQCCFNQISELKATKTVTEHSEEETRDAVSYILPYLELTLLSNLVVAETANGNDRSKLLKYLTSFKWHELSLQSDCLSAKLKQATFLHVLGWEDASLKVLESVENRCSPHLFTFCDCRTRQRVSQKFPETTLQTFHENIESAEQFMRQLWAPCVLFLPTEKGIIPAALVYEIYRYVGIKPESGDEQFYVHDMLNEAFGRITGSRNFRLDYWFDWAIVDGKFLLYFLLYLNHAKLRMKSHAFADIDKMDWVLRTDERLGHRETDLNLLGWACKQEGLYEKAIACFVVSLLVQKTQNAALWHLLVLLFESLSGRQHF